MEPPSQPHEEESSTTVFALMSPASYRASAFAAAAKKTRIDLVRVVDLPTGLHRRVQGDLALDFANIDQAVSRIVECVSARESEKKRVAAVIAIDDRGAEIAAQVSAALELPHNDPEAALAARDKYVMRERLAAGGVPVPVFNRFPASIDPEVIAGQIDYPCVVKPLLLSGSRGIIRANHPDDCVVAFRRTRAILESTGMLPRQHHILIEKFVPGFEVALEGLLTDGRLQTLALFDKPDPLDGPYFEETIYVTPSRLPPDVQAAISLRTAEAAHAVGLREGPVHAELRIDLDTDNIWLIELAGRSIGGLCSSVLEFGTGRTLEELILLHAAGMPTVSATRSEGAAGVMMIPIPRGGMFRGTDGIKDARAVPGVTGIEITAPVNQPIVPLPEGESYLGFIFARGEHPHDAESSLRTAHKRLLFKIEPILALQQA